MDEKKNILDQVTDKILAHMDSKRESYINRIFPIWVRVIIGVLLLVGAGVFDYMVGFSYTQNHIVVVLVVFVVFSLINALFSSIYKISFSYPIFMIGNII